MDFWELLFRAAEGYRRHSQTVLNRIEFHLIPGFLRAKIFVSAFHLFQSRACFEGIGQSWAI
jgi:hypothetical protein